MKTRHELAYSLATKAELLSIDYQTQSPFLEDDPHFPRGLIVVRLVFKFDRRKMAIFWPVAESFVQTEPIETVESLALGNARNKIFSLLMNRFYLGGPANRLPA